VAYGKSPRHRISGTGFKRPPLRHRTGAIGRWFGPWLLPLCLPLSGCLWFGHRRAMLHGENPAELRAWVRANTGLDVPIQASPPASIQLIGARNLGASVEIAYRAGNRDALLSVSRADAGSASLPHGQVSGNESSWVADGERFTLAASNATDLQLACKLCHLD
jgi:hypothetical protein